MKQPIPRINMANLRKKNQETKASEDVRGKANDNAAKPFQDGDVRAAILELIGTDEDVMKSIVDSVSQVIVTKLLTNETFITKLADGLMKDGVLDAIKQNVYEACALEDQKISSTVESLERRVGDLDNDNRALREELDKMEQYSRRNCLAVHCIPESETKEDCSDALLHVFNGKLNVSVAPHCIDRSHRLGRFQPSSNKPRPVIVKFVSYVTRRQVFSAKRRLKGTNIVVTENLTKRRSDLLNRTRAQPDVKAAWTTDGRIVCLFENGEKRSIVTERDLDLLHRHQ